MIMTKIIFVNPPLTGEERYGALARGGVYMPPLGLGSLSSVVRAHGYDVKIIDCEALHLNTQEAAGMILKENADFIGLTAATVSIKKAAELATVIKNHNSELNILIGGAHITAVPEETMLRFNQFDVGVIGEGEVTIVELLNALTSKTDIATVKGIIYRQGGHLIKTEYQDLIKDLDGLPFPAWDLYPDLTRFYKPSAFGFQKLPSTSIVTSRGCPSNCSFCNQGPWGRLYREHSAEYVMEMIRTLFNKYKIRDLAIYDGTFGVNKSRLIKLCELLIKERFNLAWSCNLRINMADVEILKLMRKAGCWGIAYGIESGSQKILEFIGKGITKQQISRAVHNTKKAGIITKGYIMVGTLAETKETLLETLGYVPTLDLDLLTVNHFTPFPGTLDYERADKFGSFNKDWSLLNEHSLVFIPKALKKEDIEFYITKITKKFYFRPRIIFNFLKLALNLSSFRILIDGFLAFLSFLFRGKKIRPPIILKVPRGRVYFSKRIFFKALSLIIKGNTLSGDAIKEFEEQFADYIGIKYAISTYSGTLSLCLCLDAFDIKEGDEVILPAYMVPEVVEVIKGYKANPVFIDIDPTTNNMDPKLIEGKIGKKTKAIVMAHIYGQPCDIEKILKIARTYNLKIIEDCAQACGAEYKGRKVGTFGDVAYFSFGVMKNMNTLGGGMITTGSKDLAYKISKKIEKFPYPKKMQLIKKYLWSSIMAFFTNRVVFTVAVYPFLRVLNIINPDFLYRALYGNKKTDPDMRGISLEKYRLRYTNLQARVGLEQLKTLEENNHMRIKNAKMFNEIFENKGFKYPKTIMGTMNIYHNYVIQTLNRKLSMESLLKDGIDTTNGYIESFSDAHFSNLLAQNNIYLPIQHPLSKDTILKIAKTVMDTAV